jgi:glycosyltransferase involved in cell wall biosynthesis
VRFNPQFRSSTWRERLSDGNPEAPLLIYVGRLATEKRVDWLRPVLEALPGVRLAVVGDGPVRAELETLFAGTPTVFTGYLRGADLAHAYASADLFAFTSANETFGNVVLEAMASGLPVVVPCAGGPVDIVTPNVTGLLFDPGNQTEFVRAVKQIVSQPDALRQMGKAARAYAESQSWEAINDDLLEKYATLTGKASPRRMPFFPYLSDSNVPGARSGLFRER